MLKYLIGTVCLAHFSMAMLDVHQICTEMGNFACNNGKCLENDKRCNGADECGDGSDEEDCGDARCDPPFWKRCKNRKCISESFVCDGEDDCGDMSDEENCSPIKDLHIPTFMNCSKGEWRCADRLCIPIDWVCNGEEDCLDGSDEHMDCNKENLTCSGFKCKNGQCIPEKWKCDNVDDCDDGSDESSCDNLPATCTLEEGFFLCHDNSSCIDNFLLCNGVRDCVDNSDEGPLCSFTQDCRFVNCSYKCIQTTNGPKCLCPHGYRSSNLIACQDVNECDIYGICDQKCKNTEGSYECSCDSNYVLQADKMTCKVRGEALMVFGSQTEIRGYYLESEMYFPIAKGLNHAVGVSYDGNYVYWTEIGLGKEQIVRSLEDGSHKKVLVNSGLRSPEDLAVDWVTGNIYFSDSELKHIAVCTNEGSYCTVLVSEGVQKPRSLVLDPKHGEMYWTDWGKKPEIARAKMDGTEDIGFVTNEIGWPNGIALDAFGDRLYWSDAKLERLESIKLDGSDRRVIFQGAVKHPYGLAVFEDRVYWSDWNSQTIESCKKFTGKDHHILLKQPNMVYDIHIYHSALQSRVRNPCKLAFCSDICLLSGRGYTCQCAEGRIINKDRHTCRDATKPGQLLMVTDKSLLLMKYQSFGKQNFTRIYRNPGEIAALAFDSKNNSLLMVSSSGELKVLNLANGEMQTLFKDEELTHVTAIDYDFFGNNVYICNGNRSEIVVYNLNTMSKVILLADMGEDVPIDIALIPEDGIMFVAFKTSKNVAHIDRFRLDGTSRTHIIENGLLGPVHLTYDRDLQRIFYASSSSSIIESTSVDGDDRHDFATLDFTPDSITTLTENLMWTNHKIKALYFASKYNFDAVRNIPVEVSEDEELRRILSVSPIKIPSHPCQLDNGNCSHICLAATKSPICKCPLGMTLDQAGRNCVKVVDCSLNEFLCTKSDFCIPNHKRCDGVPDCFFHEDEWDCERQRCRIGQFQCTNDDCIDEELICNKHPDCKDGSDEADCESHTAHSSDDSVYSTIEANSTCSSKQFRCKSGYCIPKNWECDQDLDCHDMSDEHEECAYNKCKSSMFKCDNGLCIDPLLKCDEKNDCGDNSDESACPKITTTPKCRKNEFECFRSDFNASDASSMCLPLSAKCNGTSECPKHEDEQGCSYCSMDEYECANKKCISRHWVCDQVNDCGDGSDENESVCSHFQESFAPVHTTCDGFVCKNGACIGKELLCNGHDDCSDGSDEGGSCTLACSRDNNPCSHFCDPTPTGPQCHCNTGYQLRGDGKSCSDIKECSFDPPPCSQICNELRGSFSCACYEGYVLRSDRRSCKSTSDVMSIIFAVHNEIHQLFPSNNTLKVLFSNNSAKISGIGVSIAKDYVYFSTGEAHSIHRLQLSTLKTDSIVDVGLPSLVAVDWASENVYFIDNNLHKKSIGVCNFDLKYCADVIKTSNGISEVSAMTVDGFNRYIFYAERSYKMFVASRTVLYRADLDGANKQQIAVSEDYVAGLTYNYRRKLLYFSNVFSGSLNKVDYGGESSIKIVDNITRPTALEIYEDFLYIYTQNSQMMMCSLFKSYEACQNYQMHVRFSELFVISHTSKQPDFSNVCEDKCSRLCVPLNTTVRCLCTEESIAGHTEGCYQKEITKSSNKKEAVSKENDEEVGHSIWLPIICIIIISVCCCLAYFYLRRTRSGNFTISMRFKNPLYGQLPQESTQEIMVQPGQHEYYNPLTKMSAPPMPEQEKFIL